MSSEIWKDIEGYEGKYMISSLGNVLTLNYKRTGKNKILKPVLLNMGYYVVGLCKNGKQKKHYIHRLIAQAFIPNPDNKPEIDHIDTNPLNNNINNLRWVTSKENSNNNFTKQHCSEKRKTMIGVKHPKSKKIVQLTQNGEFIKQWDSIMDVQRELNIQHSNIWKTINGIRNSAGGYKWQYAS